MYKVHINNCNYIEWTWYNESSMAIISQDDFNVNPLDYKLFSGDVIDEDKNIISSSIRNDNNIPGILLLVGKTYGRGKNRKMYYKCVPNDKRIPAFLVTYEDKNIGFNKNIVNRFVLFKYIEWNSKHPIGSITNMIGEITNLENFYEYQLYCKNLFISIKEFTNNTNQMIKTKTNKLFIEIIMKNNKNIEDRLEYNIFTIDPKNSTDLDDAIGLKENVLSVYIANVPLLMEYLELWTSFSERISTIYLPDRKRPMLPTILSDNLCSLLQNESRFAFCMDIELDFANIDTNTILITNIQFRSTLIKVKKNYDYDDNTNLSKNEDYLKIMSITKLLCKNYRYIKEVKDNHDLVAYLMILMNCESAKKMMTYKSGIYRTLKLNEHKPAGDACPTTAVHNFIKIWQSSCGLYANYDNKTGHDLIGDGIDYYIHITSPIRRLIDLLNIMKLQELLGLVELSQIAQVFYTNWISKLDYINVTMRAIRKIQVDCTILALCVKTPNILDVIYDGYVFDIIKRENNYFQYTVYIEKIKIVSRINIKTYLEEYSCWKFKLYLIEDGITLKRKIRIEIV